MPERAELTEVPFFPQDEYQCGPAALATALAHVHVPVTPDDLVSQVYIPARKGSVQVEMLAAPRRYGLVSYALAPRYADVLREVAAGTPVVTLQDYGLGPLKLWHYAVVVGYDREKGELVLRSGEKRRLTMPLEVFEYTWKDSGRWAMVAVPPSRVPASAERAQYLNAIVALEKTRQPRAAAQAYTAYLERWPDELGAGIGLANAHYALGELDRTEAVLRQTLVRHPDSIVVMNNLAQTLADAGRIDEALEVIERAAAHDGPHAAAVSETRAHILQRIQRR